jgi:3-hydroxymyristoyl/3-hydroxydecanoyl-(acyl carrier protein) dehydratase
MKNTYVSIEILEAEKTEAGYLVKMPGEEDDENCLEIEDAEFTEVAQPIDAMDFEHALAFARITGCTIKSGSFRLYFEEGVIRIENLFVNSYSDIFHNIAKELWSVDS